MGVGRTENKRIIIAVAFYSSLRRISAKAAAPPPPMAASDNFLFADFSPSCSFVSFFRWYFLRSAAAAAAAAHLLAPAGKPNLAQKRPSLSVQDSPFSQRLHGFPGTKGACVLGKFQKFARCLLPFFCC